MLALVQAILVIIGNRLFQCMKKHVYSEIKELQLQVSEWHLVKMYSGERKNHMNAVEALVKR